jgi:hypothetical protein
MAFPNGAGGYQVGDGNLNEVVLGTQSAPIAKTAAATLTPAELANGIITYNGVAANLTMPLGVDIDAAFPSMKVNSAFDFFIINLSANTATLVANTGSTLVGAAALATATSANWRVRKSGDGTFVFNRIAG